MSKEKPSNLDYTTPLFIHDSFLRDGHGQNTPNATGTFVKFSGQHYVVTCEHVLNQVDHANSQSLDIMCGRVVFQLSTMSKKGRVPTVRVPNSEFGAGIVDIGIASVDTHWPILRETKGKRAIDLDTWTEPSWDKIEYGIAYGWLNNYKEETAENLATKGVNVTAKMVSQLSLSSPSFVMQNSETMNSDLLLSGISGGAVFGAGERYQTPIGIVFEGYPSHEGHIGGPAPDAISRAGDLMIRGYLLTPTTFSNWISQL